jgi:hypothetical protein
VEHDRKEECGEVDTGGTETTNLGGQSKGTQVTSGTSNEAEEAQRIKAKMEEAVLLTEEWKRETARRAEADAAKREEREDRARWERQYMV